MYRYEGHLHTMETSRCGYVRAADQVRLYKKLGYTGICVTDHLHPEYIGLMNCKDDWNACMDRYLYGYRLAKKAGDEVGLKVILGAELRFPENDSDYLIYGVDEQWFYDNPYMCCMTPQEFYAKYGKDVLIIHAHPFRPRDARDLHFDCVHGLEIINCNPRHDSRNAVAVEYALHHPDLIRTVGSDAHRPGDEGLAAMDFDCIINDSYEYKAALEKGLYRMECMTFDDLLQKGTR